MTDVTLSLRLQDMTNEALLTLIREAEHVLSERSPSLPPRQVDPELVATMHDELLKSVYRSLCFRFYAAVYYRKMRHSSLFGWLYRRLRIGVKVTPAEGKGEIIGGISLDLFEHPSTLLLMNSDEYHEVLAELEREFDLGLETVEGGILLSDSIRLRHKQKQLAA